MEFQLTTLNEMTLISFNLFFNPPPPEGVFSNILLNIQTSILIYPDQLQVIYNKMIILQTNTRKKKTRLHLE